MKVNVIHGEIKSLGALVINGLNSGASSDGTYSEIIFADDAGAEIAVKKIFVPARINHLFEQGNKGTFVLAKTHPFFGANRGYAARVGSEAATHIDMTIKEYVVLYTMYVSGAFIALIMSWMVFPFPIFLYCVFMMFTFPARRRKIRKAVLDAGFTPTKRKTIS